MDPLPSYVNAILRHGLSLAAGWLMAKGYITAQQVVDLTGLLIALVAMGWSLWQVRKHRKVVKQVEETKEQP